jgi:hypothetical protein
VAPDNEEVQRQSAFGTPYSPISEDEQAPYVPRLRIVDIGSEAELADSASDDGEEEEEVMEVPSPPSLSAHQRDIRAARRSCVRGAFHLALLFLFTVIIPSDAADAFVAPSNASYVATHDSALNLLDFSWVLVTWLDVLHGLCFGISVTFVLFTFLAVYATAGVHALQRQRAQIPTNASPIGTADTASFTTCLFAASTVCILPDPLDLIPSPLVVDDAILFSSTANFDGRYCFLLPQTTSSFCVATNYTSYSTCFTLDHDHFGSSHGRHPHLPLALRMANLLVQYGIFVCVVRGPSSRTTQKQQHSHAMLTKFQ